MHLGGNEREGAPLQMGGAVRELQLRACRGRDGLGLGLGVVVVGLGLGVGVGLGLGVG